MDKPSFEELKRLAESQPDAFEHLRAELVENLIQNSNHGNQRRLRGLQFVIDAKRDLAGTPLKALIDIQKMMHESLYRLNRALRLQQIHDLPEFGSAAERPSNNVLTFHSNAHGAGAETQPRP